MTWIETALEYDPEYFDIEYINFLRDEENIGSLVFEFLKPAIHELGIYRKKGYRNDGGYYKYLGDFMEALDSSGIGLYMAWSDRIKCRIEKRSSEELYRQELLEAIMLCDLAEAKEVMRSKYSIIDLKWILEASTERLEEIKKDLEAIGGTWTSRETVGDYFELLEESKQL